MSAPPCTGSEPVDFSDINDLLRRIREVAGRAVDRGIRVITTADLARDVYVPSRPRSLRPFLPSSRATEIGNALHAEIERSLRGKP